jgi:alkylation response protein AidB-like acyl-CoA dehydrogenase
MTFEIVPMLAGDFHDSASRFGADTLKVLSATQDIGAARAGAWKQAVEMGWPAVLIAETHGGAGGTLADIACLVEATAGSALALPLIDRGAVVPTLLDAAATPGCAALLEPIAAGRADVASLLDPAQTRVDLTVGATHYLIALPERRLLLAVEAQALPVGRRYRSVDGRTMADVVAGRLATDSRDVVARDADFDRAWTAARNVGALLVCAEAVGGQGALVKLTIEYLATRKQFGHPLATQQVLRHRVVDMYVGYECTRGLVGRTLQDAVDGGIDTHGVSLVKSYTSRTSRTCAESAIQLHGGMGMTEELLVARLAERMISAEFDFGDRYVHLRRLAASNAETATV